MSEDILVIQGDTRLVAVSGGSQDIVVIEDGPSLLYTSGITYSGLHSDGSPVTLQEFDALLGDASISYSELSSWLLGSVNEPGEQQSVTIVTQDVTEYIVEYSNGAPGPPGAFSVVGGDAISPTANLAVNVFIRNDTGWRIAPPEEDIDILLSGNIYPFSSASPWRVAPVGNFQTSINTDNSVNAVVVTVSGGGSSGPSGGVLWP